MVARKVLLAGVGLFCLASLAMPAVADDLNPPYWRGQDGTTFARWEFLTADPMPAPDELVNPYGTTDLHVWPGGPDLVWQEQFGGRDGVWPLSGVIKVDIDNRPEALPYKYIWVQLTWMCEEANGHPLVQEVESGEKATLISENILGPTGEPSPYGDVWMHSTYQIRIEPNPAHELVRIHGKILVDELVIDTVCAPEPASVGLLSVGSVMLARRR